MRFENLSTWGSLEEESVLMIRRRKKPKTFRVVVVYLDIKQSLFLRIDRF